MLARRFSLTSRLAAARPAWAPRRGVGTAQPAPGGAALDGVPLDLVVPTRTHTPVFLSFPSVGELPTMRLPLPSLSLSLFTSLSKHPKTSYATEAFSVSMASLDPATKPWKLNFNEFQWVLARSFPEHRVTLDIFDEHEQEWKLVNKEEWRRLSAVALLSQPFRIVLARHGALPITYEWDPATMLRRITEQETAWQASHAALDSGEAALETERGRLQRFVRRLRGAVGTYIFAQTAVVWYLTYHVLGWDIMEPVSYLLGVATSSLGALYYVFRGKDWSYEDMFNLAPRTDELEAKLAALKTKESLEKFRLERLRELAV